MEDMKFDKSGATAVLGAFSAGPPGEDQRRGPDSATENLPSGTPPSSPVTSWPSGKTIETQYRREGPILSDALTRGAKPAAVIDAATLTGAVVIALGHHAIEAGQR
jgi:leucyl aminopeptidase